MGKRPRKIITDGAESLGNSPFDHLDSSKLPSAPSRPEVSESNKTPPAKSKNRGRVDVRREKSGRGGKTVTLIYGFKGISKEEKTALAKSIQKSCGVGGGVKDGKIEIQGDKREEVQQVLETAGFRVVFTGG